MIKILFLIHDLGTGGAEKVLVNLVNNMDHKLFNITVMTLFDGGINKERLSSEVRYQCVHKKIMPGNSHLMKLLSPEALHKKYIKEKYDIEISYLEGPSARIISGCPNKKTKLLSWIHSNVKDINDLSRSFRTIEETQQCYQKFHKIICVSQAIANDFKNIFNSNNNIHILYNTVESDLIIKKSREMVSEMDDGRFSIIAVGTLKEVKGYFRLLSIVERLKNNNYFLHLYILGQGPLMKKIKTYVNDHQLHNDVTLVGYQSNPYKYLSKADVFVCSSFSEGFSTATTEALIVGTPVCTVEVSGMREMLGDNCEYGIITENNEEALYEGIKRLLDSPELLSYYRKQAKVRGEMFSTETTVEAVEKYLKNVILKG